MLGRDIVPIWCKVRARPLSPSQDQSAHSSLLPGGRSEEPPDGGVVGRKIARYEACPTLGFSGGVSPGMERWKSRDTEGALGP